MKSIEHARTIASDLLVDAIVDEAISAFAAGEADLNFNTTLVYDWATPGHLCLGDALHVICERSKQLSLSPSGLATTVEQPFIVCTFCRTGYVRRDDPDWAKKAGEHVATCVKHPLHAALRSIKTLREACESHLAEIRMVAVPDGNGNVSIPVRAIDDFRAALSGGAA